MSPVTWPLQIMNHLDKNAFSPLNIPMVWVPQNPRGVGGHKCRFMPNYMPDTFHILSHLNPHHDPLKWYSSPVPWLRKLSIRDFSQLSHFPLYVVRPRFKSVSVDSRKSGQCWGTSPGPSVSSIQWETRVIAPASHRGLKEMLD